MPVLEVLPGSLTWTSAVTAGFEKDTMSLINQPGSPATTIIPIVALGVYRHVATTLDAIFTSTPYRTAAILDLSAQPESVRYSAHNLSVVLHALHPSAKVLITGAAISRGMTAEAISVFEEYVKRTGLKDALVIDLRNEPPEDGNWMAAITQRLDAKYGQ